MKVKQLENQKDQRAIIHFVAALFSTLSLTCAYAEGYSSYLTGESKPLPSSSSYPAAATGGEKNTEIIQDLLRSNKAAADKKKAEASAARKLSPLNNYTTGNSSPIPGLVIYPIAATAPTPAPMSKDQCLANLNRKLRELTEKELAATLPTDKKQSNLTQILNNQTERSFIKFSRAFVRAGYYKYSKAEKSTDVLQDLKGHFDQLITNKVVTDKDVTTIQEFFNNINSTKDNSDQFDNFANALVKFSKNDDPSFHISPADLLIMKSIITYTRSPNKRKMALRDRLLDQMRQVFPKRNFERDDLTQMKSYHDRYITENGSESFAAAKKAFADNAKQVITAYVKTMDKQCQKYYLADNGTIKLDEIPTSCNTGNYLHSLFSADPLANIEPLINYLNQEGLAWESEQFIRVAGIKATPKTCVIKDKQLTVTMDIENLPMKFTQHWYISCADCDQGDSPLVNPKLQQKMEETRTISFKGEAPKELYITNAEVPNKVKVSLESCKYKEEETTQAKPEVEEETPVLENAPASTPAPSGEVVAAKETAPAPEAAECEDPTQEKVADKCVPRCKDTEIRNDDGKCESNDPDALLASDKKEKEEKELSGLQVQRSGRTSAALPQPKLIPIPQSSFYIKAGFN